MSDEMPERYKPDPHWQYTAHNKARGRPGLTIPAPPLQNIGITSGDKVSVEIDKDDDKLIITRGGSDDYRSEYNHARIFEEIMRNLIFRQYTLVSTRRKISIVNEILDEYQDDE